MKVYPDKFHLLFSDRNVHQADICNEKLFNACSERRLWVKVDNKLTSEEHVWRFCKKINQKVNVLARISSLMKFQYRKPIFNSFITSNFSSCSLV